MCYAIPGRVVGLKDKIAVVDYFGERRNVLNEFLDVRAGDYVYAQGGILINRIPERDALEILEVWKQKFFELKEIDRRTAKPGGTSKAPGGTLTVLQKANLNKRLVKNELLELLRMDGKEETRLLFDTANSVRQKEHDNACCVHGIIEFSNHCRVDCSYCGIRRSGKIKRYRMKPGEIIDAASHAANELGFKALVLQSGEDPWYDEEKLLGIVKAIRKLDVLIFLSIGERSKSTFKKLYDAGARAALLRFETANRDTFRKVRPGTSFGKRIGLIRYLKSIGYVVATGFLIGLPGESGEDIVDNIMFTKSLKADMYSFGPVMPARGTPLENIDMTGKEAVLKAIAITRFVDRKAKILVTTALETLERDARRDGLMAGANSLMINVTPPQYRNLYRIYNNKAGNDRDVEENINDTVELLYSLGRAPTDLGV